MFKVTYFSFISKEIMYGSLKNLRIYYSISYRYFVFSVKSIKSCINIDVYLNASIYHKSTF